ncbi:TMV resistance protein N isoform X1 [Eucalyptus grandis]|uniref:TMV resistance protein N isoform X1 n=1 Tax=Eucalyptus grandis TaxID=71139 RepID=UPI00192EB655|nr:TMV resistance protein N isoform X1 [Eucalyptus grandis]
MKRNYHVFLSFRGTDVRQGFLSHLYAALDQRGIYTFVDSEELRKGEEISRTLMRAIEELHIAIIVFSEDYASSRWCLEELLKIMECKEKNGLMVFPVFYEVEPREVREGRESYKRAMDNHEYKFGKDSEKVKRWKKALFETGSLSGWELNDRDERDEAELIQSIVKELSICLRPRSLDVAKYWVGIESQVQKLISLSESAGSDVLIIGIWGPGGIGKTTIAKALYNAIQTQFWGSSFLAQVREKSNQSSGLVCFQDQLLFEILRHKELIYDVDGGISLIQERLCCKKVLLVLDDVDDMDQLNALAGKGDWFGEGSRIIVTSRDRHLLTSHDKNYVYEVKTLEDNEGRDLFGQHAFTNSNKVEIRRDLIDGALHYAGGLPLALEVSGSFLRGRKEPEWESTLHKLSKIPESKINRVLKISFDGLDENEREIFLDIACFFKGKSIKDIQEVLNNCDFDTTIGVEILIERSLIKNENGSLQMHDLVQLMGMHIVKQECRDDPGKRSRLWLLEDVDDVFCYNTGTDAVKAIVLDLPLPEAIIISPDAFTNMKKLRILILVGVHISSQAQIRLPNELRWLEWPNAPNLEFVSSPNKLVTLNVPLSHIRQLGGNSQNLRKLKSINFSGCKSLVSIPGLSSAPNMEELTLCGCESLVEVHPSVGDLVKLKVLSLPWCSNLRNFPNMLKTKSLQTLKLYGCSKLEKFPDIDGKMEHLRELNLRGTAIKELPASIENLVSVQSMTLAFCKNLMRLPSHIYKLKNLKTFDLGGCSNLITFPKNMEDSTDHDGYLGFQRLRYLYLNGCNLSEVEFLENFSSFPAFEILRLQYNKFAHMPTCINRYYHLCSLNVRGCEELQEIPQLPPNIDYLFADCCKSLQKLPDLWGQPSHTSFVGLASCGELFRKGVNMDDVANVSLLKNLPKISWVDIILIGREMPKWILPCEEHSIFFMVPRDLYDKLKGLALCIVLSLEEGKVVDVLCDFTVLVNGKSVKVRRKYFSSMESDHVWLYYCSRDGLLGVEKLLRNDWSHFQVCVRVKKGSIKKCGFRLICEQKEDDLRVVFPAPSADRNKVKFFGEDS